MEERGIMKVALLIAGMVLFVIGAILALQELNVIAGGAMSGHRRWLIIGGALIAVGIVLGVIAKRLKKRPA
jgi:uncharacterized membrane protein YedE/YeeE